MLTRPVAHITSVIESVLLAIKKPAEAYHCDCDITP
jgi:hypothetical protein